MESNMSYNKLENIKRIIEQKMQNKFAKKTDWTTKLQPIYTDSKGLNLKCMQCKNNFPDFVTIEKEAPVFLFCQKCEDKNNKLQNLESSWLVKGLDQVFHLVPQVKVSAELKSIFKKKQDRMHRMALKFKGISRNKSRK